MKGYYSLNKAAAYLTLIGTMLASVPRIGEGQVISVPLPVVNPTPVGDPTSVDFSIYSTVLGAAPLLGFDSPDYLPGVVNPVVKSFSEVPVSSEVDALVLRYRGASSIFKQNPPPQRKVIGLENILHPSYGFVVKDPEDGSVLEVCRFVPGRRVDGLLRYECTRVDQLLEDYNDE